MMMVVVVIIIIIIIIINKYVLNSYKENLMGVISSMQKEKMQLKY